MRALCFSANAPMQSVRPQVARRATCAPRMAVGEAVTPGVEIVAGSIALVTPVFVAAVLFGERIVRQRRCTECAGSGLVPVGPDSDILKRCSKCGGFLPWQSFRRFLTGPIRLRKSIPVDLYNIRTERESANAMADSNVNPDELMARIQEQVNAQMGEAFREQVTSKCFTICVPSPSKTLTTRESACLDKCLDRFVEAMNLVTQALANRSNRGM